MERQPIDMIDVFCASTIVVGIAVILIIEFLKHVH